MGHSFIMTRLLNCFFSFLWFTSPSLCWEEGGYLAEITSMSEFSLLELYLLHYETNYWIGLTDQSKEGTWIWSDSHVGAEWTNWGPGLPDSYNGHDEDCVNLLSSLAHKFNDNPCDALNSHALCEA